MRFGSSAMWSVVEIERFLVSMVLLQPDSVYLHPTRNKEANARAKKSDSTDKSESTIEQVRMNDIALRDHQFTLYL